MRKFWTRSEKMSEEVDKLIQRLKSERYYTHEITKFIAVWHSGKHFAEMNPAWYPTDVMPEYEAKVLLYLDNDTIQSYTFYYNNKELMQLFKNHTIAWMYQPNKPIFKDE